MNKEFIECPKCKGCGKIKFNRRRNAAPLNNDPSKKWCYKCKTFLDRELDFYKKTFACKKCHNLKTKVPLTKEKRKAQTYKFPKNCVLCGENFIGRKTQKICSRSCNINFINKKTVNDFLVIDVRETVRIGDK